ncbi:mRNA splicing factor domain-containing protein [Dioscorea alata]|uniref:mRNA splicing factor domain-containing protein n=1 Tax=Dioscorea alata TaxID=55571 RepID=A0ACB7TQQ8_DIOAL|nr:mRNA splicing factor domain-containing protein [Dioscorea alata]
MDLEVIGRHALLFDDDTTSAFVNSREALVPWIHDSSLFIDRYDVRHLLDQIPSRKLHARSVSEDPSQSDLDLERYLDLPPPDQHADGDGDDSLLDGTYEARNGTELAGHGAYQAVPFSSGDNVDAVISDSGTGISCPGFRPNFALPDRLLTNLPPTEKLHQIISRTALFVSEHGGQSEIILRVKQGNNPTFGFLMPDHHLHPYYRFLVDHPELLKADDSSKPQNEKSPDNEGNQTHVPASGALSLLGSVYGSGEEDDMVLQTDSNQMEIQCSSVVASERTGSSVCLASKDNVASKNQAASIVKDKTLSSRKKNSVNTASPSDASKKKRKDENASHGSISRPLVMSSDKPSILEPPSFLKRVIDKIVEFIHRNGKDFEAVLIEQDKAHGRFPFLLPTNQYHPYYLKILQGASENNVRGSSVKANVGSNKDAQAAGQQSTGCKRNTSEELEGWSYESSRKEKFKMVIGAPKKDVHDQDSKPMKPSGVTPDEAEAIVLAATRGASPANVFSNKHKNNLGVTSNGSFSSLNGDGLVSKPASTSDANNSGQLSSGQFRKIDSVDVVKEIAKSAVLAASNEGDSSEVSLSKEQKLKAERLKRAKIFAAMIKSGQEPMTELIQAPTTTTHSTLSGPESDPVLREREGSSVPNNCEISDIKRSRRDSSVLDHDREHKHSRKKRRSRSRLDENDSEEDHGHYRKKRSSRSRADESDSGEDHRHSRKMRSSRSRAVDSDSEEDHRHYRKRHHSESSSAKHHKRHSSKESRHHRHRHHDSSEDEHRHMRHSKSRQRHKSDELSDADDQERKRSSRHHRSTQAHFETEVPSIEDEKISENLLKEAQEVGGTDGSHAGPSVDTEIPSELRAKIRNMLLEIM